MTLTKQQYQRNLARLRAGFELSANDAIATGNIFIQSELNKPDLNIRMPLEGHTWFRDMPIQRGGGWVDTETSQFVNFSAPADNGTGTNSNDIRVLSYSRTQDVYATMAYQISIRIPLVASLKLAQANKSPQELLDKGVRLDWNKTLDKRVYVGAQGHLGLLNQTIVAAQTAPIGTQATPSPSWNTKLPIDILNDLNFAAESAYTYGNTGAEEAIPDRFLIPASAFVKLMQPMTLAQGNGVAYQNILGYIKANYFGAAFGITPDIKPLPVWAETAGVGGTRRMVAYRYSEDCLAFGILQDLMFQGGPLSLQDGAFVTTAVANTGIVKVFRPSTINYYDGI